MVDGQHHRPDDTPAHDTPVHRGVVVEAPCPHCQSPAPIQLAQNEQICPACGCAFQLDDYSTKSWQSERVKLGKFELLEEVGRGGFGRVYKARDAELDRIVAVKVPRGGQLATADDEDRFVREARAAAQLHHPGIVPVYEVGRGADYPYIVSEFVHGVTLNDALTSRRFTIRETAELVAQVAIALDHAHRKGVVHRDLKPSNIMLERNEAHETLAGKTADTDHPSDSGRSSGGSRSGGSSRPRVSELNVRPRIMDFGLARRDDGEVTVTIEGQVLGTPAYMSPEQARGEAHSVERTSDVYSLGVILFELLTGELPFRGNKQMLIHQAIHDDAPSPRKLNHRIARDMETICLKCLRKEPGRRYGTARELADDLDRFLAYEPILARPVGRMERGVRWLRRHPAAIWTGVMLFVLAAAGVLGERMWRQKQEADAAAEATAAEQVEKIEYFVQLSRRRGELVGIGPITEAEAYVLPRAHRFISKGGVVQRVELVNAIHPDEDDDSFASFMGLPRRFIDGHREATRTVTRDEEGLVVKEEAFDAYGQLLWTLEYLTAEKAAFLDRREGHMEVGVGASRLLFRTSWDAQGWLREIRFEDEVGNPRPCNDGNWGVRLTHSADGVLERVENLDQDGQPLNSLEIPSAWTCKYDSQARLVERSYLDAKGNPVDWDNVHRIVVNYTDDGSEESYFDLAGHPSGFAESGEGTLGPHKRRCKYSQNGRTLVREAEPALGDVKGKLEVTRFQIDGRGNILEMIYLDASGQPRLDADRGDMRFRQFFDEAGNLKEKVNERLDHTGAWVTTSRHNSAHRALEQAHYTDDGHPKLDAEGVHRYVYEYDSQQNRISTSYFGMDGTPVSNSRNGYHREVSKYDDQGRQIEARFFAPDGGPALYRHGGSHFWREKFDAAGNCVEGVHYGPDEKPMNSKFGFAKWTKSYNAQSELLEACEWMVNPDGEFVLKKREDGKGNVLEIAVFTASGEPALNSDDCHRERYEYDTRGNRICIKVFGASDNPVLHKSGGSHCWRATYDDSGNVLGESHYGVDEQPINSKLGWAKLTNSYDAQGELLEACEWVVNPAGEFALKKRKDGNGNVLENAGYTATGEAIFLNAKLGFHRQRNEFDEDGNVISAKFFDENDQPAIEKETQVHGLAKTYDSAGRNVEGYFFDRGSRPMNNAKWGMAKWHHTFDDQGKLVEIHHWIVDQRGNYLPWRTRDGDYHTIKENVYDAGKLIETQEFVVNSGGEPVLALRTNATGKTLEQAHFDEMGNPVTTELGYHRVTFTYDTDGNVADEKWFAEDGTPLPVKK